MSKYKFVHMSKYADYCHFLILIVTLLLKYIYYCIFQEVNVFTIYYILYFCKEIFCPLILGIDSGTCQKYHIGTPL